MLCCGCGVDFGDEAGPIHRYILSSPGCWAAYGRLLTREYEDQAYWPMHRMTVDAYAVQHPGEDTPQSRASVGLHLSRLCLSLERGWPIGRVNEATPGISARQKDRYPWLTPPAARGGLSVAEVLRATDPEEHRVLVAQWARAVWNAWSRHHEMVRGWVDGLR
jgi:hypothetical protein